MVEDCFDSTFLPFENGTGVVTVGSEVASNVTCIFVAEYVTEYEPGQTQSYTVNTSCTIKS